MQSHAATPMGSAAVHGIFFSAANDEVSRPAHDDGHAIIAHFKNTAGSMEGIEHGADNLHAQLGTPALQTYANTVRTEEIWKQFGIEQKAAAAADKRIIASNRPKHVRTPEAPKAEPRNDN